MSIYYFDRLSNKVKEEKVYRGVLMRWLYRKSFLHRFTRNLICRLPVVSRAYGMLQKTAFSGKKVAPFITTYSVDASEFLHPVETFTSFNDFFIRKLKPESRPIVEDDSLVAMPADGRYLVYPNLYECDGIWAKGRKFSLYELLGKNEALAKKYEWGSAVIVRLAPMDYHRFHFPCDATPGEPTFLNGALFSVNPIALRYNIDYLTQNKRMLTLLDTQHFGQIAYIEIGATCVGTIHQTYTPGKAYQKGDEKGYFSFGGSCLILLFEPDRVIFAQDLIEQSKEGRETRGLMGQLLAIQRVN